MDTFCVKCNKRTYKGNTFCSKHNEETIKIAKEKRKKWMSDNQDRLLELQRRREDRLKETIRKQYEKFENTERDKEKTD